MVQNLRVEQRSDSIILRDTLGSIVIKIQELGFTYEVSEYVPELRVRSKLSMSER